MSFNIDIPDYSSEPFGSLEDFESWISGLPVNSQVKIELTFFGEVDSAGAAALVQGAGYLDLVGLIVDAIHVSVESINPRRWRFTSVKGYFLSLRDEEFRHNQAAQDYLAELSQKYDGLDLLVE